MKTVSDNQINELFAFIFGWHNVSTDRQRDLIADFLINEAITLKQVFTEIDNF